MIRVLVCGGRDFIDKAFAFSTLDFVHRDRGIVAVIEGGARGADRLGGEWASSMELEHLVFRADWKLYGKAAGSIRNGEMLQYGKPDLVIAFPGGRGTADMVKRAKNKGVEVMEVAYSS